MTQPTYFATPQAFRDWLSRHHDSMPELLVGFRKVGSGVPSMTWAQAVDQALCFGWIDGVRRRIDDERYSIRFTPRRPGGTWSSVNIDRIAALKSAGLMQPAGLAAFANRTERRSRTYSYERKDEARLRSSHEKLLKADKKAWAFFQTLAPSYRKKVIHYVISAKAAEVQLKRLNRLIDLFARGKKA